MALTDQPYLPLYVKDWLTSNKLKLCSLSAHGLMINMMCVMHRENEYGSFLLEQKFKQSEQQIFNFATVFAKLLPFTFDDILPCLIELIDKKILVIDGDILRCNRMVKDAELSITRSKTGSKGGKKTAKRNKEFAKAKTVANTAIAIEVETISILKPIEGWIEKYSLDEKWLADCGKSLSIGIPTVMKLMGKFKTHLGTQKVDEKTEKDFRTHFVNWSRKQKGVNQPSIQGHHNGLMGN